MASTVAFAGSLVGPVAQALHAPLRRHDHFADRAERLLRQLSLDEKIAQMSTSAPAVTRPGGKQLIPAFEWWSECLHGAKVDDRREHGATIFPQPLALAATFNSDLVGKVASAIGDELRAMSNAAQEQGQGPRMTNCFGPNINIYRDPRWGRGSETYGEDPELTGDIAKAVVRGLQGNHSFYLKAGATCKHFAAYSFEEWEGISRFEFDAHVDPRDVRDTYLPAFHACTSEAAASSVMCSYNAINGTPACANTWLLRDQLRGVWKFGGFVVSDCGAINSITEHHEWVASHAQGFATALKAGTDLACMDYSHIRQSLDQGLVSKGDIDAAVRRLLLARFALGHFDEPGDDNPYRYISPAVVGSRQHLDLARRAAAESIVLLKNTPADAAPELPAATASPPTDAAAAGGAAGAGNPDEPPAAIGGAEPLLPLKLGTLRRLTVLGPLANRSEYLLGNYYGYPAEPVITPYEAIQQRVEAHNQLGSRAGAGSGVELELLTGTEVMGAGAETDAAAAACRRSDACIFFVGTTMVWLAAQETTRFGTLPLLSPVVEGEGWDRKHLTLPGRQLNLIQAVAKRSTTPIVVVLLHGGPLDVEWLQHSPRVAAVLTAWAPGHGGAAVADVLFGDVAPAGRLPVTFYFQNFTQQSDFTDMSMRRWPGRTHRYLQVPVLYPFGHGLSYTTFAYSGFTAAAPSAVQPLAETGQAGRLSSRTGSSGSSSDSAQHGYQLPLLRVSVNVANTGGMAADEVVLLFLSYVGSKLPEQQQAKQRQEQQRRWWLPLWGLPGLLPRPAASTTIPAPCTSSPVADGGSLPEAVPVRVLAGFQRVHQLAPAASAAVSFNLTPRHFVPFSPLSSSSDGEGSKTGGWQLDAQPYCGAYLLQAGDQRLTFWMEGVHA